MLSLPLPLLAAQPPSPPPKVAFTCFEAHEGALERISNDGGGGGGGGGGGPLAIVLHTKR